MIFPSAWLTCIALILVFLQGCGLGPDRVAGTSSGVDNPQLTLAFTDSNGLAARITGTVSLYSEAQNPAVVSEPLATIRIDNSAFLNLSSLDLNRSVTTHSPSTPALGLAKTGQGLQRDLSLVDSIIHFNVYLKTDGKKGALAMNLAYDAHSRKFVFDGDSNASRIDLLPKPLQKVQGVLGRVNPGQGPDRIFIPGTPFFSVLVDSNFVFDDVPEGLFKLRLLTGDGQLVDIKQPLNPREVVRFTLDEVSTQPIPDTGLPVNFKVTIQSDSNVFVQSGAYLVAKFESEKPGNWPVTWLWRLIDGPNLTVDIHAPTEPNTPVRFKDPGLYTFELSGTIGTVTHRDTTRIAVEGVTLPETRFFAPGSGQVVPIGRVFRIVWQSKLEIDVRIHLTQILLDSGIQRTVLDSTYRSHVGVNEFYWNVDLNYAESNYSTLMLTGPTSDTLAQSTPFAIRKGPPPDLSGPGPH